MIHRAPFGSLERFTGLLIEHFGGNFPLWLSPEQVRLLPITDDQIEAAKELQRQLRAQRIRCSIDSHSDKFGAKIRRAEMERVPYMFVLGKNEVAENKVTIRCRINKSDEQSIDQSDAIALIQQRIATKTLPEIS